MFLQNFNIGGQKNILKKSTANLTPLLIPKEFKFFKLRTYLRNPYLNSILRQICYNTEEHFDERKILLLIFFMFKLFSNLDRKMFGSVVKTALYVSRGTF